MQYILIVAIAADIYALDYTMVKKGNLSEGITLPNRITASLNYKHIAIKPILVNTLRITRNI